MPSATETNWKYLFSGSNGIRAKIGHNKDSLVVEGLSHQ